MNQLSDVVDSRDAQRVCMGMPTVTRTMTVGSSPEQVVNYLKDFANSEEWDPATQRCTRVGSGSIEVGTSWRNVSKVFGKTIELTYTLEELTDDTIVFVGKNATSTDHDTITVNAAGRGSVVRYRADLTLHGAARLFSPVMKILFEKLASDTATQMSDVLNRLGGSVPRRGIEPTA